MAKCTNVRALFFQSTDGRIYVDSSHIQIVKTLVEQRAHLTVLGICFRILAKTNAVKLEKDTAQFLSLIHI